MFKNKKTHLYIAFSAEAFFFAGCSTVLILSISACVILKKKAPVDPLFYGMNYTDALYLVETKAFLNVCSLWRVIWI